MGTCVGVAHIISEILLVKLNREELLKDA